MKAEKLKAETGIALLAQPCVTRFELAAMLRVSVRTVDRMIAASEIRVRRIRGKAVRFLRSDVEQYLNGGTP
ncbi:MAG: helix-turn-helix domain-containing protein [Verrucomicrobiae bacterium]|nr:helix-turn-helix domain-containing protein [Verrucomicrobiae bacterium]